MLSKGSSVYVVPGMSTEIGEMIQKCNICNKHNPQRPEPLISSEFPELPWQKLGTDLFTWKGFNYLLVTITQGILKLQSYIQRLLF